MATLLYGNGDVEIQGTNIRGVQIAYKGAITINKECGDEFSIAANKNTIIVFPLGQGSLDKLFCYEGDLKITSVIAVDDNAEKVPTTIKRVMDFPELMGKAEDITINSEDLNAGYVKGSKPQKTAVKQQYIENLNTKRIDSDLYTKDGKRYEGEFHIDPSTNIIKTGAKETLNSKVIARKNFRKKEKPIRIVRRSSY